MTQEGLAAETGDMVSQATVSDLERGKVHPTALTSARLHALLQALRWTPEDFKVTTGIAVFPEGVYPGAKSASEWHLITRGQTISVYAAGTGPAWDDDDVLERMFIPGLSETGSYIGLKATGDSMAPYLHKGELAILHCDDGAVKPGDFCGVWLSNDGVVIKRFVKELPDGSLLLESLNPEGGEHYFTAPLGSRVLGKVIHRLTNG